MKILVVDDNKQNLYLLEQLLRANGYEVVPAGDGVEALEKIAGEKIDLIVTDILMPRMDGFQFCRQVKTHDPWKLIPFIFYTATYTDAKDEAFALSLGADRFIIKPEDPEVFNGILKEVISNRAAHAPAATASPLEEESVYMKLYNERLIRKLEDKMSQLDIVARELARKESRLRQVIETAPECIKILGEDGNVLEMNPAGLEMIEADSLEPVVGLKFSSLVAPEHREAFIGLSQRVLRGESATLEFEMIGLKGTRRWMETHRSSLKDEVGKISGFLGIMGDITERKRAEEALQHAQARIESVLESMTDVHILFDRNWHYLYVNNSAVKAIGRPREQILGCTLWELYPDIVGTELERQYRRSMDEHLPVEFDFHYATLDMWWANRFYPAPDGLAVFATNITARKQAEEELRKSREQFRALAAYLQSVREEKRKRIARELHDEIGQALTAIKLSLETNVRQQAGQATPGLAQALGVTNELIDRVRNLSLDLRPAMLDDLGLLPALAWQFDRYHCQVHIKVDFKYSGLEGRRFGSEIETAVYRIVQEALTNVARHVRVDRVDVGVWADEDALCVRTRDQGAGFYPDSLTAITGGLSGMRERAIMLGGRLNIESAPGAGTLLLAKLPLRARVAADRRFATGH